jgi:transposase
MERRSYTDEFRRRAVDLYESTPGATLKGIARDLGVSRGSLKEWVDKHGSRTRAATSCVRRPSISRGRRGDLVCRVVNSFLVL